MKIIKILNREIHKLVPMNSKDSVSVAIYAALEGCTKKEMKQKMQAAERDRKNNDTLRTKILSRANTAGTTIIATVPEGIDDSFIYQYIDTAKSKLSTITKPMRILFGPTSMGTVFATAKKVTTDEQYLNEVIEMATEFGPVADILAIF